MKIAIVTDTHFDVRNSSPVFAKHIDRFFENVFFPHLAKNKDITHVLHCGDVFDRRKNVSVLVASQFRLGFIEPIQKLGLKSTILVGNHDAFFRHTNTPNSPYELYGDRYPAIEIISEPSTRIINGVSMDLYPWINEENEKTSSALMLSSPSKIAFGHFEWAGYMMAPGQYMDHGRSYSEMSRYDFVRSGHYHERNGPYLGTAYDLTWADYGSQKGFHVFDPKTLTCEFIPNPHALFVKLVYTDDIPIPEKLPIAGRIVRLTVNSRKNTVRYEKFIRCVEDSMPHSLQIIDDTANISTKKDVQESKTTDESTLSLLMENCDIADTVKRNALKTLLADLHYRASSISAKE